MTYKIQDGLYKIKSWEMIDNEHTPADKKGLAYTFYGIMESQIPKHRYIEIIDSRWRGEIIYSWMIMHPYYEYGEVVYVTDDFCYSWRRARFSHSLHTEGHPYFTIKQGNFVYCVTEEEYKHCYPTIKVNAVVDGKNKEIEFHKEDLQYIFGKEVK